MKKSRKTSRALLATAILCSCIGCDQVTKKIATESLSQAPAISYFGNTLRLEYALNSGGFLSLGSNLSPTVRYWTFIGLNAGFMLVLLGLLIVNWNMRLSVFVSVAFLLAGGIGNLIDRMTQNGMVTDFINVGIGPVRTGVFNVADMAVLFGAIAVIWFSRTAQETSESSLGEESHGN